MQDKSEQENDFHVPFDVSKAELNIERTSRHVYSQEMVEHELVELPEITVWKNQYSQQMLEQQPYELIKLPELTVRKITSETSSS